MVRNLFIKYCTLYRSRCGPRRSDPGLRPDEPLLYFRADWSFAERWHFIFDIDALAGGPGRAIDLTARLAYDIGPRWGVTVGYRTVEGGADVDEVYNFAWFNAATASVVLRF